MVGDELGTVRGRVTIAETGGPVAGARVTARLVGDPEREPEVAETDGDGRFTVASSVIAKGTDAAPGQADGVLIEVWSERGERAAGMELRVAADTDARLDLAVPLAAVRPGLVYVAGELVDLAAAARLTVKDLIEAYRALRGDGREIGRRSPLRRAFPELWRPRRRGEECAEGHGDVIRVLLEERGGEAALRDLDEADADDFPSGTTVDSFFTTNIVVRYTTDAGDHTVAAATPAADSNFSYPDGTLIGVLRSTLAALHPANTRLAPTYVQKIGLLAEDALARFIGPAFGLRDPRAGAARMEYRILKQSPGVAGSTTPSWSHVEVAPGASDAQIMGTTAHELFHQVQYRYHTTTTRSGIYSMLREGGARLAEDSVNDRPNRYVDSGKLIFDQPALTMIDTPVGTPSQVRYASGLFWKWFAEHHSTRTGPGHEPAVGVDSYRAVLEASATVGIGAPGLGYTTGALRNARGAMPWYGTLDRFGYYDAARTELGSHETSWGNYLLANWFHAGGAPVTDARFDYLEDDAPVSSASVARLADLSPALLAGDDVAVGQAGSFTRAVAGQAPWSARFFRFTPDAASPPRMLRVAFTASAGLTDPLVQVVRVGAGPTIRDIHRFDSTTYSKTIRVGPQVEAVLVIVATRDTGGSFQLDVTEVASASDAMITRWNTAAGREYEIDPRGWAWTWISPDVMVDNDGDGLADPEVFFDRDNVLKVRLRNRGNAAANNVRVDLWYQKATPYLSAAAWIPLRNDAGAIQSVGPVSLAPGTSDWFAVAWAPADDGTHHPHWCVKARITAPGDANTDNKLALSNFSRVVVDPDGDRVDADILLRRPERHRELDVLTVPRGRWRLIKKSISGPPPEVRDEPCLAVAGHSVSDLGTPTRSAWARLVFGRDPGARPWDGSAETLPQPGVFYPVDPESLPPGVDPEELVTVVQRIDGVTVGGVTYALGPSARGPRRAD